MNILLPRGPSHGNPLWPGTLVLFTAFCICRDTGEAGWRVHWALGQVEDQIVKIEDTQTTHRDTA